MDVVVLVVFLIYIYEFDKLTFIKAKLKKSDNQTNIEKYRVAGNITEHTTILKLIFQRLIIPKFTQTMMYIHAVF